MTVTRGFVDYREHPLIRKPKQRRKYCDHCDKLVHWNRWGEMNMCVECGGRVDK